MKEKIKTGLSVLIILTLLPYVAAVFRTGSMGGIENTVQDTGIEQLVAEILPAQMPVSYEEEALKAQAVVVRTNLIVRAMEYYGSSTPAEAASSVKEEDLEKLGFSFYSQEEQIRLWGYDTWEHYEEKCIRAAEETAGKILVFASESQIGNSEIENSETENSETENGGSQENETGDSGSEETSLHLPAEVPYHAVSAGCTRDGSVLGGEYSWLESAECPGDLQSADYLKIETVSLAELPEVISRDGAGYVTEVRLEDQSLGGEEFRARFELQSSCFTAEQIEEGVRIVTKGLGHGLGMSMYQANLQALSGRQYEEILQYFYKNLKCISFS